MDGESVSCWIALSGESESRLTKAPPERSERSRMREVSDCAVDVTQNTGTLLVRGSLEPQFFMPSLKTMHQSAVNAEASASQHVAPSLAADFRVSRSRDQSPLRMERVPASSMALRRKWSLMSTSGYVAKKDSRKANSRSKSRCWAEPEASQTSEMEEGAGRLDGE
ncbi:MAG: hypothetical protein BWY82_02658 [Verrucomicrobia bacterium ADurb.Bin474]|nr:MAG: hypothetical protein BWY82_02658 [Verrucomicrobia bacterium ADurb.Bin474]